MRSAYLHCKYVKDGIRIMARMPIDKYFFRVPYVIPVRFWDYTSIIIRIRTGLRLPAGARFSLLQMSRPALGAHPATYSRDTEDYFTGSKAAGA
jgi:hypothetical protein